MINFLLLKRLTVALVLFLWIGNAFGQFESRKGQFNVGVEGGVQFTDIRSDHPIFQSTSKMGYAIGAFGDYYINNDFRVRLSLNYDSRAVEINSNVSLVDSLGNIGNSYYLYQVDYNLNYLTIPIGILYTRGGEKFKVLLQLNFYYSIFLNATMDGAEDFYIAPEDVGNLPDDSNLLPGHNLTNYNGSTTGVAYSENNLEPFNSYDLGFNFMLGALYQITPSVGLTLTVGFTYGLADVYENPQIDSRWSQITRVNLGFAYTLWK